MIINFKTCLGCSVSIDEKYTEGRKKSGDYPTNDGYVENTNQANNPSGGLVNYKAA